MYQELLMERNLTLIKTSLEFFKKELNISEEDSGLIEVKIVKRLRGALGRCMGVYTHHGSVLSGIKIEIAETATTLGIIETLAHEMVHAKQNLDGHFHWVMVEKKIFFGLIKVKIPERAYKGQVLSETSYYDQLCEQEAHTVSLELVTKFMNHIHNGVYKKEKEVLMIESF